MQKISIFGIPWRSDQARTNGALRAAFNICGVDARLPKLGNGLAVRQSENCCTSVAPRTKQQA